MQMLFPLKIRYGIVMKAVRYQSQTWIKKLWFCFSLNDLEMTGNSYIASTKKTWEQKNKDKNSSEYDNKASVSFIRLICLLKWNTAELGPGITMKKRSAILAI